jgi:DNA-binding NarL/FixJ family response regulator
MRILLADDHPQVLERDAAFLRSSFDVVGTAHNGDELIAEAKRLDPDVIVSDIVMPGTNGIEAARTLHETGSRAKFVFLTVHSEDEFVRACMAEGGMGYVIKSRMGTDLIPAINAAFSGRHYVSRLAS